MAWSRHWSQNFEDGLRLETTGGRSSRDGGKSRRVLGAPPRQPTRAAAAQPSATSRHSLQERFTTYTGSDESGGVVRQPNIRQPTGRVAPGRAISSKRSLHSFQRTKPYFQVFRGPTGLKPATSRVRSSSSGPEPCRAPMPALTTEAALARPNGRSAQRRGGLVCLRQRGRPSPRIPGRRASS